jgi:hypothetical protein
MTAHAEPTHSAKGTSDPAPKRAKSDHPRPGKHPNGGAAATHAHDPDRVIALLLRDLVTRSAAALSRTGDQREAELLVAAVELRQAFLEVADALFAKRTEVKSSNDRYANQEVNYLLQRIESFTGIAMLTTNHESAVDEAFRRRLSMHIRFPMPERDERSRLWQAMIPAKAAIAADVDFERLAEEFTMSGGYIRNAVLRAAFLAADAGEGISMRTLWHAARGEYEAMGKIATMAAAA